jgi:hypothetical protein
MFFNGKDVNRSLNADEAAVRGASIYAAIFSGHDCPKLNEVLLLDVLPMTLGIETPGGLRSHLIVMYMVQQLSPPLIKGMGVGIRSASSAAIVSHK